MSQDIAEYDGWYAPKDTPAGEALVEAGFHFLRGQPMLAGLALGRAQELRAERLPVPASDPIGGDVQGPGDPCPKQRMVFHQGHVQNATCGEAPCFACPQHPTAPTRS